jgi:hypothetical protein
MAEEFTAQDTSVGEMHKRREVMADGRRYIIYYTFGADEPSADKRVDTAENRTSEVPNNV